MLSRAVALDLPKAYLSESHGPGAWRAFQQALEDAAVDDAWVAEAEPAAPEEIEAAGLVRWPRPHDGRAMARDRYAR